MIVNVRRVFNEKSGQWKKLVLCKCDNDSCFSFFSRPGNFVSSVERVGTKAIFCSKRCCVDVQRGKSPSDDARKRMSEAQRQRWTPERRAHRAAKMRERMSRPVNKCDVSLNVLETFSSVCDAALATGVHHGTICYRIRKGVVFDGFIWRYASEAKVTKRSSSPMKGTKRSAETIEKHRKSMTGKKLCAESSERQSVAIAQKIADGTFIPNVKSKKGTFLSEKTGSFDAYDSLFEKMMMVKFDHDDDVSFWTKKHGLVLKFQDENKKNKSYVPDFLIEFVDKTIALVETKGAFDKNRALKRAALESFCEENDAECQWIEINTVHDEYVSFVTRQAS